MFLLGKGYTETFNYVCNFFQVNTKCFDDILEHLQRFKIFLKMGFESQEIKNINSSPYLVVRPWSN